MAKPYILKKGESLAKVAERTLGDRKLAGQLAGYNGLLDAKRVVAGQAIHIPTARELKPVRVAARAAREATCLARPAARPAGDHSDFRKHLGLRGRR
jgi:hypothetical protein